MPSAARGAVGAWPPAVVVVAVPAIVSACRALGFGDGVLLAATPASAVALGAALVLRWRGAVAAGAGFALAGLAWGLGPGAALTDGLAHGLAALLAWLAMRTLARRRRTRTRTNEWLISLAGVVVFTAVVATGLLAGELAGLVGPPSSPRLAPLLAAIFEPLGILTFAAVLANRGEVRRVLADPLPAVGTFAIGLVLLGLLWLLLAYPTDAIAPSGITLLLAIPFCLWIAMQRRSLDGGVLSFVAAHVVLLLVLHDVGGIDRLEFAKTVLYLDLLVAASQLVHSVNLDRLNALAEVEAHKRELEARVAERTAGLEAMTARALAADEAKSRFLATVSHEVRTPLNGVIGMASFVLSGELDEATRRNVAIIRTSGLHLLDVINRLLDFSKLDHPIDDADVVEFDLRGVVEEVLEEARFLPHADGLELRAEFDPKLATRRRGYRQGVRQILTNLVGNAARFTDRGSVTVRALARPGETFRVEVRDTGIGIPPSVRERIFLPFEQAGESASRRSGGTGLGLAICAEIVKRLGGRIGVESDVGIGSMFWFEVVLPVVSRSEDTRLDVSLGA